MTVTQSCPTICDPMDCMWDSLGQNTGVSSPFLLQGIFPTQGLNSGLLHCRRILYQLSHKGSPRILQGGSLSFPQRIFLTHEWNHGLLHCRQNFTNWAIREAHGKPRQRIKKQKHHFANKGPYGQSYRVFSVVMHGCESWTRKKARKNWCFQTVVLETTLESPLDCKEIKLEILKEINLEYFIVGGGADAEAEAPLLWPPEVKHRVSGKDWCWERLKAKGEGDDREWDGKIPSQIQQTRKQWRTKRPGMLQSTGLQRVRLDLVNQQQSFLHGNRKLFSTSVTPYFVNKFICTIFFFYILHISDILW